MHSQFVFYAKFKQKYNPKQVQYLFVVVTFVLIFLSCKKEKIEEHVVVQVADHRTSWGDTDVYATKEPYVEIKDRGFEGMLVIFGYDLDNQINGKVAKRDLINIRSLNFDSFYYSHSGDQSSFRYDFYTKKYDLKLLYDTKLLDGQRKRISISNLSGLQHFPSLYNLECSSMPIDSLIINFENNITHVKAPRKAKHIDLDSCKMLRVLNVGDTEKQLKLNLKGLSSLEQLHITGDFGNLDLSNNSNLSTLMIANSNDEALDFSQYSFIKGVYIYEARILRELNLHSNILNFGLVNTGLTSLNFSQLSNLKGYRLSDNEYLKTIDLSSASKMEGGYSKNNKLLTEIFIDKKQIIDTSALSPVTSPTTDPRLWQKDPWTKWVVKE